MNLLTDYAFKKVFGTEENKNITIKFLNSILKDKEKIVDVTFKDKERLPFYEDGKKMVFDIYCTTSTKSHIIVEMQRQVSPTFPDRAIAYCAHGILNQIKIGKQYKFEKVYGIFVMDKHLAYRKPKLIRRISLMDEDTAEIFSDKQHMVFLDLKCMRRSSIDKCENDVERWMFLLKNMENMEDKLSSYPVFDELFEAADTGSLAEEDFITYGQSRMKLEEEREAFEYQAAQERMRGREEGIKEGIKEGERNILRGIIGHLKNQGLSLQEIVKTLGLPSSDVELLY